MRNIPGWNVPGVGGGAAVAAAALLLFWMSQPVPALAASCTPTANGQAGGSSRTNASGTQSCSGGDTGVAYQATGGDLTVNLNNDAVTPHGINITDDGAARNLTVNLGGNSAITATDSGNYAVTLTSSGGNVQFISIAGGTVSYSGSGASGAGIFGQSSASGSVSITTGAAVTNLQNNGIVAQTVNGAATIAANASVNANAASGIAILAKTSGSGNAAVSFGTLGNSCLHRHRPDRHRRDQHRRHGRHHGRLRQSAFLKPALCEHLRYRRFRGRALCPKQPQPGFARHDRVGHNGVQRQHQHQWRRFGGNLRAGRRRNRRRRRFGQCRIPKPIYSQRQCAHRHIRHGRGPEWQRQRQG